MAVDIKGLSRPEHDNAEKVCPRNEGNDKRETKNARSLSEARWEHGVLGAVNFPQDECNKEKEPDDERC